MPGLPSFFRNARSIRGYSAAGGDTVESGTIFPLFHSVRDFLEKGGSSTATGKLAFDLMTFREHAELTFTDDAGQSRTVETNERYYTPPEMRWLLQTAGFAKVDIFGCRLGAFSRDHALAPDDFEMLVIAETGT
jgi:hypothetical protein